MTVLGGDEGIQIELKKGETELKITMGNDVSRSKIKAVKEMISPFALDSSHANNNENKGKKRRHESNSLFYRLKVLIANVFRYGQIFTSRDVREAFREVFGKEVNPSTCSTYLRRMERDGFLTSEREGRVIEYRLSQNQVDLPSLDELENEKRKRKELATIE